jgi:hypothetical protein
MIALIRRRCCWLLFLAGFLSVAVVAGAAAVKPVAKPGRNRLNFLLLGDPWPVGVPSRLQQILQDEFNFYLPADGDDSLAVSAAVSGDQLWHGVVLTGTPVALADATRHWRAKGAVVVWVTPTESAPPSPAIVPEARIAAAEKNPSGAEIETRVARLAVACRDAILSRSTRWATPPSGETRNPAHLLATTGALDRPADLPLASGRTTTLYRAEQGGYQFNLHSYLAHHDGRFWAIWSSGHVDEDGPSQLVRYATSADGLTWSEAAILVDDPDGPAGPQRWMANGLYVENGQLYALATRNEGVRNGQIWADAQLIRFRWDQRTWREDGLFANDCLVYFPPLRTGRYDFVVWRNSRAHFATAVAKPGSGQWSVTRIPGPFPDYRLSETAHYVDATGVVHLIIRDQGGTGFLYHAVSYDEGVTWTIPVKTNYPDAMSKNFAARLSNGWFYLISNPKRTNPHRRDPLAISFSRDGWTFGQTHALRRGAPDLRYPGKAKEPRSFQYSHAIEHDGRLWVIYSTNKEDIEVSVFELPTFSLAP